MRLRKIKLTGFKSFVDPTVLDFKSPLVAIVGPNGCGKSNVIDAVRWVMGESSAKTLRGESMSDVIFNGSATRKPVGQASIELVFDNAEGKLGGEYASYAEIAIRRQVTREGQSDYFLNGTRCRRRDITDIFLGTGLGPRSYAIIEQGMISRVIEAKPEELRSFVEEAAGVSLYRKRRHETELRMRHTKENLERLNDIRLELDKQLERLKRQSESARKYQEYKEESKKIEGELAVLSIRTLREKADTLEREIRALSTHTEEKSAQKTRIDTELEKLHLAATQKGDAFQEIQSDYYHLAEQIARLEQTLEHQREREASLKTDFLRLEEENKNILDQTQVDEEKEKQLSRALEELKPTYEKALEEVKTKETTLQSSEEALKACTEKFEVFQQEASLPEREAEVEKAKITQLEKNVRDSFLRLERLQKEEEEMNITPLREKLGRTEQEMGVQENLERELSLELETQQSDLTEKKERFTALLQELDVTRNLVQTKRGRLASLETLQQAALGKTNERISAWLSLANLHHFPRLGEDLKVDTGYEKAVETVLGNALEAVCLPGLDAVTEALSEFKEGELMFLSEDTFASEENPRSTFVPLKAKVNSKVSLQPFLKGVYVTDDLSSALSLRAQLSSDESVITQDGLWMGPNWLKVYRGDNPKQGIFDREKEIQVLTQSLSTEGERLESLQKEQESLDLQIKNLRQL